jgi:hypothetical protein
MFLGLRVVSRLSGQIDCGTTGRQSSIGRVGGREVASGASPVLSEWFAKRLRSDTVVIPAKAGIQKLRM